MNTKRCFKCGVVKPIDEFYRHPRMADGHLGKCKECAKNDVREHSKATRPDRLCYEQERWQRPERRAAALVYQQTRRKRYPQKDKARRDTTRAIRSGKLTRKPCDVCGTTERVEAHHDDYSKPLDVRWLCFRHHRELHGQTIMERPA